MASTVLTGKKDFDNTIDIPRPLAARGESNFITGIRSQLPLPSSSFDLQTFYPKVQSFLTKVEDLSLIHI